MRTVTAPLQPLTSDNARDRYGGHGGWCCDLHCYRVTASDTENGPARAA